jgi:hypothetical protein
MTVLHVLDMSQGHKFECDPEVTCAKTARNTVSLVVNVGKAILVPFPDDLWQ